MKKDTIGGNWYYSSVERIENAYNAGESRSKKIYFTEYLRNRGANVRDYHKND